MNQLVSFNNSWESSKDTDQSNPFEYYSPAKKIYRDTKDPSSNFDIGRMIHKIRRQSFDAPLKSRPVILGIYPKRLFPNVDDSPNARFQPSSRLVELYKQSLPNSNEEYSCFLKKLTETSLFDYSKMTPSEYSQFLSDRVESFLAILVRRNLSKKELIITDCGRFIRNINQSLIDRLGIDELNCRNFLLDLHNELRIFSLSPRQRSWGKIQANKNVITLLIEPTERFNLPALGLLS